MNFGSTRLIIINILDDINEFIVFAFGNTDTHRETPPIPIITPNTKRYDIKL